MDIKRTPYTNKAIIVRTNTDECPRSSPYVFRHSTTFSVDFFISIYWKRNFAWCFFVVGRINATKYGNWLETCEPTKVIHGHIGTHTTCTMHMLFIDSSRWTCFSHPRSIRFFRTKQFTFTPHQYRIDCTLKGTIYCFTSVWLCGGSGAMHPGFLIVRQMFWKCFFEILTSQLHHTFSSFPVSIVSVLGLSLSSSFEWWSAA